jgi:hypothetical protein
MTPEQEIARSEAAKRLYNDPLFKEAMDVVRREIIEKWEATPARDVEGREWLWQFHQAANKFDSVFKTWLETGKLAELGKEQPNVFERMRRAL